VANRASTPGYWATSVYDKLLRDIGFVEVFTSDGAHGTPVTMWALNLSEAEKRLPKTNRPTYPLTAIKLASTY
jgi:hypothetical protein